MSVVKFISWFCDGELLDGEVCTEVLDTGEVHLPKARRTAEYNGWYLPKAQYSFCTKHQIQATERYVAVGFAEFPAPPTLPAQTPDSQ